MKRVRNEGPRELIGCKSSDYFRWAKSFMTIFIPYDVASESVCAYHVLSMCVLSKGGTLIFHKSNS